jgi:chloramphenicol 3-O-phosphotransferase
MAIRHKRKNSTGYTWQTGDLVEGQIGLNIADGTLHFDKADGSTVTIGAGGGGGAEIDDEAVSTTTTWSSDKIDGILGDIEAALAEIEGA